MKVNTIANPVKLPGTMLTIFLDISQFSDCHTTLNHFQHGMTKSNLQFWSVSGCFLKNNFGGNANNDNDGNPTPCLLHLSFHFRQGCCNDADAITFKASFLSPPSAAPVGRFVRAWMQ
jgi:hypothetical protein